MSNKRRKARKRHQAKSRNEAPTFDVHSQYVLESMAELDELIGLVARADEPLAELDETYGSVVHKFVEGLSRFEPVRLVEVARMAMLPIVPKGEVATSVEATAAYVELIAVIALAAEADGRGAVGPPVEQQDMAHFVTDAREQLSHLMQLSQVRAAAGADPTDRLAMIGLLLRGSQVMVRNPSYPDMVSETLLGLLDGDATVKAALQAELGFCAADALAVLEGCHEVQIEKLNDRAEEFRKAMDKVVGPNAQRGEPTEAVKNSTRQAIGAFFEPDAEHSTVGIDELASKTGLNDAKVQAVVERFRLDLGTVSPAEVIDEFMAGRNPMRTHPVIVTADDRVMLPHSALSVEAVKENLETHLKTSNAWQTYQKHRGIYLERRTLACLEKLFPGATRRDGFEYYIPANDAELATRDPAKYTKRVEGDHLVILDDVAVIIEDKAVALSSQSKGGNSGRIRKDLVGIVTKAAEQSGRLQSAIERDGGVRVEDEAWVDLSHIREIHTIAVSLDDLMSVTAATAERVLAGFLDVNNIPWTVSVHDLELITLLVDRPAEFLLYLRRRRNPSVTVLFRAADELDLFLYCFEAGLWVEPDPDLVREAFPFLPPPTAGERRRFREQYPGYITSRTDALDRWYYTRDKPGGPAARSRP